MNRKKLILIIGAAVVVIAGGATAYAIWGNNPPPPDPETAKPEEVTKYLASDQFAKLPVEKKQKYFESLHRENQGPPHQMMRAASNLSEKQREQLHENMRPVFMARMREEINQYFELPPEQQTAYLDEMIDRHEQMRQQWQDRRPDRGNNPPGDGNQRRGGPGGRGHWGPEHFKRMIESTPPEDRARFMEFRKAMHKRRQERGLPEEHHGPRH